MAEKKIYPALVEVQCELKAPKDKKNSFGGYNYRSCESILEAVKPLLKEHGLMLLLSDNPTVVEGWHFIEATATLSDMDGNCVSVTAYAREPQAKKGMDDSQVTGTASSYARKYALNGLFCIDDTKDADTDEYQKQTAQPQRPAREPQAAENTQSSPPPICACCGKPLQPVRYKNRTRGPKEVAGITEKKFGRVLCWDCAQKQPKEENGGLTHA